MDGNLRHPLRFGFLTSSYPDICIMSTYDTKLLDYITLRHSTHLNYHHANIRLEEYKTLIPQAMKFVQDLPSIVLKAGGKDPKTLLELGIRYLFSRPRRWRRSINESNLTDRYRQWTGYGVPSVDKPAAAAGWTFVAFHQENVPVPLKARAYSLLARGWLDLAQQDSPKTLNISYLYDAGNCANEAVALGLISPAVLMVGSRIEAAGFRRPGQNKFPEYSTERFERFADLWEALDARKAELAEESLKREAKVSKDPLSYSCAAEDCGIVATKKSTLWRCGGKCPREFKPSYCSKYCQTAVSFPSIPASWIMVFTFLFPFQDRKHHKPYCRPDAKESSVRPTDSTSVATTIEQRPDPLEEDANSEKFQPGPERSINVDLDGRNVQIASSTIPPHFLREMKGALRGGLGRQG